MPRDVEGAVPYRKGGFPVGAGAHDSPYFFIIGYV